MAWVISPEGRRGADYETDRAAAQAEICVVMAKPVTALPSN